MQMQRAVARARADETDPRRCPRAIVEQFHARLRTLLSLIFFVPLLVVKRKQIYRVCYTSDGKQWKLVQSLGVQRRSKRADCFVSRRPGITPIIA